MAQVNLPAALGTAYWDKQKASLQKAAKAPTTKLPDELKELAKLNGAVDWDEFNADNYDDAGEIAAATSELDKAVGSKIKSLLAQLQDVEKAATSFETEAKKDKAFPKEPLTAVAAIIKAAKDHRDEVNASVEAARKALKAKADKLAAAAKKAGPGGPPPKQVALAKSRLVSTIGLLVKPGGAPKPVRFMIVQGKKSTGLALSYVVGPAQEKLLKSLMPGEAPYKVMKDPVAQVLWENKSLTFVSDKLSSSILKKIQVWLKKQFKLNPKMRVRKSDGKIEEGDEGEDLPDDLLKPGAPAASTGLTTAEVSMRRADMQAEIKQGLAGPAQAQIKALYESITQLIKAGKADEADEALDEMEALLQGDDGGGNDVLDEAVGKDTEPEGDEVEAQEAEAVEKEEAKPGAAFTRRMTAMGPAIKAGLKGAEAARIKFAMEKIGELTGKGKFVDADKVLDALEALLKKAGGDAPAPADGGAPLPTGSGGKDKAMASWKTSRAAAVSSLKGVATQVAEAKHASSAKAIIELQAVIKNLTPEPATLAQVTELQRWLESDDVVSDVCELSEDIRTPLLGALTELRTALAA